jgi:hypothetical protein
MTAQSPYEARLAAANRIIAEQNRKLATAHGALMPFARHYERNEGHEFKDDTPIEIPISDLRRAIAAIAAIKGRPCFPAAVSSEHPAQAEVTIIMAEG